MSVIAAPAPSAAPVNVTQIKKANAQAVAENQLIDQLNKARAAHDWQSTESLSRQLIAMAPGRWQYSQALGDAQLNLGKYSDAVQSYAAALQVAGQDKTDAKPTRRAMSAIYTNQGNAYLKLKRPQDATAAYSKAAQLSDNPATAYFNLCATYYNTGETEGALKACDQAIAADPNKADAYFIKGSLLVGNSTLDANNKVVAPPGAAEALRMYLKLAPTGSHADDVRQMLDYINGKGP
jgi:tetratricopeptide (TPR) repeat protein